MPPYYNTQGGDQDRIHLKVVRGDTDTSPTERQYLFAVEKGDYSTVHNFLEESSIYFNININCVDSLGRTALHIAIENENIDIIELLLSYNIDVGDTLLYAIDEEVAQAVEILLGYKQPKVNKKEQYNMSLMGQKQRESNFTPDITPVILAAHKNNYEILKMLIVRGATIVKPHPVKCGCYECVHSATFDSLRHSQTRMNAYRALASPSLMILSSDDPILTAFELSWELHHLSFSEVEFKEDYIKLSEQCTKFAVDLLDQTRGSQELKRLLNRTTDANEILELDEKRDEEGEQEQMNLSRFKLSIEYRQKPFVAHANCQQLLSHIWYAGIPGWRQGSVLYKVAFTILISITFPLTSLFYILFPFTKAAKVLRNPFVKFINHSAAYVCFLLMLVLASQNTLSNVDLTKRQRPPNVIELFIVSYVMCFIWKEMKEVWENGFVSYTRDLWNIMDFMQNSLYLATITLRAFVYLGPELEITRKEMTADDPLLVAEGLFAVANISSTMRLLYLFTANSHLGPLQISLGRMIIDIIKFLSIFGLVVISFASGMNQLFYLEYQYHPLHSNLLANSSACVGVVCPDQNNQFQSITKAITTLYWTVMGIVDLSSVSVNESHSFTKTVGMLMYATYHIVAIVVLLNMLIAMLNLSYEQIIGHADVEWKYARAKMWMSYFEEGGTVPAPFAVIPSPKSIWKAILTIRKICIPDLKELETRQNLSKLASRMKENDRKYQDVLTNLTQRYIAHMKKTQDIEPVTEDDLNEIKQDISSFRFEVIELLRKEEDDNDGDKHGGRTRKSENTGSRPGRRSRTLKKTKKEDDKHRAANGPSFLKQYANNNNNKKPSGNEKTTPQISMTAVNYQNMNGAVNNATTTNIINNNVMNLGGSGCSMLPVFFTNPNGLSEALVLMQDDNDPSVFKASPVVPLKTTDVNPPAKSSLSVQPSTDKRRKSVSLSIPGDTSKEASQKQDKMESPQRKSQNSSELSNATEEKLKTEVASKSAVDSNDVILNMESFDGKEDAPQETVDVAKDAKIESPVEDGFKSNKSTLRSNKEIDMSKSNKSTLKSQKNAENDEEIIINSSLNVEKDESNALQKDEHSLKNEQSPEELEQASNEKPLEGDPEKEEIATIASNRSTKKSNKEESKSKTGSLISNKHDEAKSRRSSLKSEKDHSGAIMDSSESAQSANNEASAVVDQIHVVDESVDNNVSDVSDNKKLLDDDASQLIEYKSEIKPPTQEKTASQILKSAKSKGLSFRPPPSNRYSPISNDNIPKRKQFLWEDHEAHRQGTKM